MLGPSSSTVTDAKFWMIQGGITKNWFGLGNTSFYGEYGEADDYIKVWLRPVCSHAGFPAASSDVDFYGIGVVQQIDAAAMELYLGWRRFETDVTGADCRLLNGTAISTWSTAVPASGSDPSWT